MADRHEFPYHLLVGTTRNEREAQRLVSLDVLQMHQRVVSDNLLACFAQERELQRLITLMEDEVQMVAAMSIVTVAMSSVRSNIRDLLARARSIAQRLAEARTELDWFRSTNQSLVAEIRDGSGLVPQDDAPLARAKERLWLVEESLLHSMTTQQVHLQVERHSTA